MRIIIFKSFIRLARNFRERSDLKDLEASRQKFDQISLSSFFRVPCDFYEVCADGVPAEWVATAESEPSRVILYFHGGAYVSGSPRTHRYMVARISREARARAMVVDYRLAPEHPHPAAIKDAETSYQWLLKQEIEASRIAVVGDSAGGGLAVLLLQRLRDRQLPLPACCVCISPWTDLSCSGRSMETNTRKDPMLNQKYGLERARLYAGYERGCSSVSGLNDPGISPLYGDLSRLPPILIQVGTEEVLLDDSRRLAVKAEKSGTPVELQVWENMIHVWHYFARFLPPGRRAIEQIGGFIRKCIPDIGAS
jgi:acetyl esterase/lipase